MDIFGGSKTKSSSSNQAFSYIKDTFSPVAGQTAGASNALAGLLGIGGDPAAAQQGFQNYLGSTGYQFQLGQGLQALTANNATKGLLNSGSALKGAEQYGQGLASNYFQQYLSQLGGLGNMGLQAGGLISGAGATSQSKGKESSGGLGDLIGGGLGMVFSDVRLKKNIRHVATDENGIRYHEWEWNDEAKEKFGLDGDGFGVIAQELMTTPYLTAIDTRDGYFAVHYGELPEPQELREAA
jgi:hypothetical protein